MLKSDACAAVGAISPKEAVATNNCWKSFILPHTKNAQFMGKLIVSTETFLGMDNSFNPK